MVSGNIIFRVVTWILVGTKAYHICFFAGLKKMQGTITLNQQVTMVLSLGSQQVLKIDRGAGAGVGGQSVGVTHLVGGQKYN